MANFNKTVYQFILSGGKFNESDFIRFTGFGGHTHAIRWGNGRKGKYDLNKAKQRQYITQDGKQFDLFIVDYNNEFDNEQIEEMEAVNIIADILSNYTREEMKAELKKIEEVEAGPIDWVNPDQIPAIFDSVSFLDYTDKSFVVFGQTFPIKEILKAHGGRFNPFLTHPFTQEALKGWIFPAKRKEVLRAVLETLPA